MHSLIKTLDHEGKSLTLKQWAIELDMPYITIYSRLRKGLPIEKVLSTEHYPAGNPNWIK